MTFEKILFYLFATVLILAAAMVITRKNPVHAVLFLVLAFFNAAGLWLLMEAEFLAIALVLVYVGAVMVLFLFVVMMLDVDTAAMRAGFVRYLPVGLLVAAAVVVELFLVVGPRHFGLEQFAKPVAAAGDYGNTEALGELLYTVYLYPFEIAAVILLVAIIAAINLTLRKRPETRYLDPSAQVRVRRADRVRLVHMEPED
ncbi:MAG: NADH-quinone oxidoreductase subunit J [Chromatiales bacterium]|jgi:NADH-quinone oxidoreductase subunit J